jgi:hypothetical protein
MHSAEVECIARREEGSYAMPRSVMKDVRNVIKVL